MVAAARDEAALVAAAAGGDEAAFAALVAPYQRTVLAVCVRMLHDRHAAEDAAQATLLAAWRSIGRFESRSSLATWLRRIAANACIGMMRKRVPEPVPTGPTDWITGARTAPADHAERIAEHDRVSQALARLPEEFRVALVLREVVGLDYAEIATVQGVEQGTVASRINRAKRAMVALLGADHE